MKLYKTDKKVVKFSPRASQFLNGITSNELSKNNNAFLDIHGKIIATFDQLSVSDDEVYGVFEAAYVDQVLSHIDKYLKLGGVLAEILDLKVYFDLDGDYSLNDGELAIDQKKGKIVITSQDLDAPINEDEFTLFRLKENIPMHGIDYADQLLLNVSEEEFVSFTKGCYLGQEPISKVHSRSKPTWKLVVKAEDDCTDEEKQKMTSKVVDLEIKKIIGFTFVKNK